MNPSTLKLFLIIVFHSFILFSLSGTPVTILLLLLQVVLPVNFSLEFPTLRVLEECPIVAFSFLLPFIYLASSGLSCGMWDPRCGAQALKSLLIGSRVHGLQ